MATRAKVPSPAVTGPDDRLPDGRLPDEGALAADPSSELVEVVDEDGKVLDVVTRARMRSDRLRHRCTFVVVRDPHGRLLVHRRSLDKDIWPGCWDLAAGGVVHVGEEWETAAARELAEEVGVSGVAMHPLTDGAAIYDDAHVAELARVWTVTWDGPVTFADGEVVEARWVTVEDLSDLVDEVTFVPDSLELVLPHVRDAAEPPGPTSGDSDT